MVAYGWAALLVGGGFAIFNPTTSHDPEKVFFFPRLWWQATLRCCAEWDACDPVGLGRAGLAFGLGFLADAPRAGPKMGCKPQFLAPEGLFFLFLKGMGKIWASQGLAEPQAGVGGVPDIGLTILGAGCRNVQIFKRITGVNP